MKWPQPHAGRIINGIGAAPTVAQADAPSEACEQGGDITLGDSSLGGLLATVRIPV